MPENLTVTREHRGTPGTLDGPRYRVTTATGATFTLAKEFYAAGPSLFTWVLTGQPEIHEEFRTKTAALGWVVNNT